MKALLLCVIFSCAGCTKPRDARVADAAFANNFAAVKALVDGGAYVDSSDLEDKTALYYAALNNNDEMAKYLIGQGARVDRGSESKSGEGPLHTAAYHENVRVTEVLLEAGANPNLKSDGGITPLHCACWRGSIEIVKRLVSHGADVNALTNFHQSALHVEYLAKDSVYPEAARIEVAAYMFAHGADPRIVDHDGKTAGQRARAMRYLLLADFLDNEEKRLGQSRPGTGAKK